MIRRDSADVPRTAHRPLRHSCHRPSHRRTATAAANRLSHHDLLDLDHNSRFMRFSLSGSLCTAFPHAHTHVY